MPALSHPARALAELRALLSLATPIIIAQLAHTAMGFVDAVMAGRVSPRDLAAVALGNSLWVPVYLLMTGLLLATTPKVAQRFGGGKQEEIGPLVRQALWLGLVIGCIASVLLWNARPVLQLMQVEPELTDMSMRYLQGIAFGFPAVAIYQVLRCFSDGLGRTRPSMIIGICGLLLNIPLNYVLIYGHFGMPALGGVGCGWASGIVMWMMLLALLWWVHRAPYYQASHLFRRFDRPQWPVIQRLLSIGVPIGISIFAEASIFSVIALLIGGLGATVVAGHQIALNFSSLVFMIPYSLGMAATVRVGQALGRGQPREARFSAGVAMGTALGYACLSASLMFLLRHEIAQIYTSAPEVIVIAGGLIVYSALFQFSDAIQVTAAGALRGYQDTRATMVFTLFAYWGIGLPVGYALGLSDLFGEPSGPKGLWQGLVVGLTCAAVLLGIRLQRSARRHIRVQSASETVAASAAQ
ncbi:MATE family efflux transporter [Pseudomonas sp. PDM16]|uniref:MATE family efflux transporter n=1 Tax=Pseudomonas sp. PDM16 TaxID=2769292 RepID=UPI0017846B6D|nr:MATE family efflux transporter [Pseudomonas sp. PDM16]MBD9416661.1 MATE family efflux transporter [Pseudomonas sp. PDM16]